MKVTFLLWLDSVAAGPLTSEVWTIMFLSCSLNKFTSKIKRSSTKLSVSKFIFFLSLHFE